jgi:hypothetical protein
MHVTTRRWLAVGLLLVTWTAGCRPGAPRWPLGDDDPVFVIPAIKQTAQAERLRDVPRLIELLDSEDSATRLYASQALRDLTGETMGYQFWDTPARRKPAVDRWKRFAAELGLIPAEDAPAPEPGEGAAGTRPAGGG